MFLFFIFLLFWLVEFMFMGFIVMLFVGIEVDYVVLFRGVGKEVVFE